MPPGTQKGEPEIIDKLHKRWHICQDHTLLKTLPSCFSPPSSSPSFRAEHMRRSQVWPRLCQPYLHCSLTVPPVSQDPEGCPCLCPEPRLFPSPDLSMDSLMKTWGKWLLFGYPHLETNARFCSPNALLIVILPLLCLHMYMPSTTQTPCGSGYVLLFPERVCVLSSFSCV